MEYLVLDTCVILHILRNKLTGQKILAWLNNLPSAPGFVISVVTKAELESLKIQQGWGEKRCKSLDDFLAQVTIISVNSADVDLLKAYAQIDSYSKGKAADLRGDALPSSARTMGKNDLWIAATAYVLGVPLATVDGDFGHLNSTFLTIESFK